MKKIKTFFKKDPNNLGRVIDEIDPDNLWVLQKGIPTVKRDGTSSAIIDGEIYKRYDARINKETKQYKKPIPIGAISCQEPDYITGHHPHWVKCDRKNNADKYHFDAFDKNPKLEDGTYELIGEKVQGNPERIEGHLLIKHGSEHLFNLGYDFETIKKTLSTINYEGIVFHEKDGDRMCKIRKKDFGIKR